MIFVTGGAGFIGGNFVLDWFARSGEPVVNIDKLTYAGNLDTLTPLRVNPAHVFARGDIGDRGFIGALLRQHKPRAIINFAAQTHVDRSIQRPDHFIDTNIVGTFHLLESVRDYWSTLAPGERGAFRFLHISTDEVYGALTLDDPPFSEAAACRPSSPYSASKASGDHFMRAWHHTYGLPVVTTNCSNNYGPYQFPEKLIPLTILNALNGKNLPVYGDGLYVRDWLHVSDHCAAIRRVLEAGRPGEIYNIGGLNERRNIDLVHAICAILDEMQPLPDKSYAQQIAFVADRPGHDRRYAINIDKIRRELGWAPKISPDQGLRETVRWYIENRDWAQNAVSAAVISRQEASAP